MIPITVTVQFEKQGKRQSAAVRLDMEMTGHDALQTIIEGLALPDTIYSLMYQRNMIGPDTKLFMAGVAEGSILQLTVNDERATIVDAASAKSISAGVLQRLGWKPSSDPLPLRAALVTPDNRIFVLRHSRALIGRADERLGYPVTMFDAELSGLDPNKTVSRPHALIVYADGVFTIRDLYSQRGVLINGQRLSASSAQQITDEDLLTLGDVVLQFRHET